MTQLMTLSWRFLLILAPERARCINWVINIILVGLASAESIDLLGRGGPGVLPWQGLGCPQSFPSFPKRFVENALVLLVMSIEGKTYGYEYHEYEE